RAADRRASALRRPTRRRREGRAGEALLRRPRNGRARFPPQRPPDDQARPAAGREELFPMKLLYKPVGIVMGILAGLIGRQLFDLIWGRFDQEEPPEATTKESPLPKGAGAGARPGGV